MTQQTINVGTVANDGTGDPIRTSMQKTNGNFSELYGLPGGAGNLFFVNTANSVFNADVGHRAASLRLEGYDGTEQFRIETVPNADSFITARGGVSGGSGMPVLVSSGTANDIPFSLASKGLAPLYFGNGTGTQVVFNNISNGVVDNWLLLSGNILGAAPQVSVDGSDSNIDLSIVPKGAGVVRFGTTTAGTVSITADMTTMGSIAIKDSGGTARKIVVV